MNTFFTILFFALGASVGSFITVLIHRTRHYETGIVAGRSKCTHCKKELGVKDLIPILSFVVLKAKCRKCKKRINSSYFIIELLTAAVFTVIYVQNPFVIGGSVHGIITDNIIEYSNFFSLLYQLLVGTFLIVIFFYDLFYKEIPDAFSIPLILIVIVGGVLGGTPDAFSMLTGALIGLVFFGAQFVFSKGRWIGGGDIRLGIFMGFFLGWELLLLALFLSYLIGATFSVGLIALRRLNTKSEVAFGPFLIAGTVIAQTYGTEILNWYFAFTSIG